MTQSPPITCRHCTNGAPTYSKHCPGCQERLRLAMRSSGASLDLRRHPADRLRRP